MSNTVINLEIPTGVRARIGLPAEKPTGRWPITPPGNINIEAATDTRLETHFREDRKSGLFSSGGFGVTLEPKQEGALQAIAAKPPAERIKTCLQIAGVISAGGRDLKVTNPNAIRIFEKYSLRAEEA